MVQSDNGEEAWESEGGAIIPIQSDHGEDVWHPPYSVAERPAGWTPPSTQISPNSSDVSLTDIMQAIEALTEEINSLVVLTKWHIQEGIKTPAPASISEKESINASPVNWQVTDTP